MLLKIPPSEVKLGMFIESFEGRWSDRPFWQTRFTLTDPRDLERLRDCAIEAVVIDTVKGRAPVRRRSSPAVPRSPHRAGSADPGEARAIRTAARAKRAVVRLAEDVRLGRPIAARRLAPVVAELSAEVERNGPAILRILRLKNRDEYTYIHSVAVSALMMNFARALGLDEAQLPDIGIAGLLHDVGKIVIPSAILDKSGPLTAAEFAVMKTHPEGGCGILRAGSGIPAEALDVCLHHHERMDGKGYPFGHSGEALSLAARMGAICDVYDALTSDRAYKDAWTPQHALGEMARWKGHFDPALLATFMQSLGIFPVGALVRVRDNALGVVAAENPEEPDCPVVRCFYSIPARRQVPVETVAIRTPGILALERPERWRLPDWETLLPALLRQEDASAGA